MKTAGSYQKKSAPRLCRALELFTLLLITAAFLPAESLEFQGNTMTTVLTGGEEHTVLRGNAVIKTESTEITAEEIELYGDDFRYARCRQNVEVIQEEKGLLITCSNLFYDRRLDLSRIQGRSVLEDRDNEVVIKSGFLEYDGEKDIALMQIGVRILGEDFAGRSEFARYDKERQVMELSGMPVVNWKDDTYRASRIVIDLEADEISLEGEVRGEVITGEDSE
ncbi:MAG: organic solvent tolerance protein OstA [Spirochaetales bacterium]|nr:organic solvent tolerance protein OstA [Spirochaetales bacterium]MCF7939262.1 organic solvent tolerance protein OstA [Spirochaetales bacterium]